MIDKRSHPRWFSQRFVWLVLVLACLGVMPRHAAAATTTPACSASTPATIAVTLPPITVWSGAATGTMLGSPVSVTVPVTCADASTDNPATIQEGFFALNDSFKSRIGGVTLQTGYLGVAVVMTASSVQASAGAGAVNGGYGWKAATVTTNAPTTITLTFQFMKTGAIAGGTIASENLVGTYYYYGQPSAKSTGPLTTITLSSTLVTVQACSVNTDSTGLGVNLPTVSTQALKTATTVAGRTRFNINLTCQTGSKVSITMSPSSAGTATGTIASTGVAKNVNVQLLDGSFTPVDFTKTTSLGATPSGTLSIPYYAQYYATDTVGAGSVKASATFTMTYQ